MTIKTFADQKVRRMLRAPLSDVAAKDGQITGYASVFDSQNAYGFSIAKGAFSDSISDLSDRGRKLHMLDDHSTYRRPIGYWETLQEDDRGLHVTGRLMIDRDNQRADEIYQEIEFGIDHGLSVGFFIREARFDDDEFLDAVLKAELFEISVVLFGADPLAGIDTELARSISDMQALANNGTLPDSHQLTEHLVQLGFSRNQLDSQVARDMPLEDGIDAIDASQKLLSALTGLESSLSKLSA